MPWQPNLNLLLSTNTNNLIYTLLLFTCYLLLSYCSFDLWRPNTTLYWILHSTTLKLLISSYFITQLSNNWWEYNLCFRIHSTQSIYGCMCFLDSFHWFAVMPSLWPLGNTVLAVFLLRPAVKRHANCFTTMTCFPSHLPSVESKLSNSPIKLPKKGQICPKASSACRRPTLSCCFHHLSAAGFWLLCLGIKLSCRGMLTI